MIIKQCKQIASFFCQSCNKFIVTKILSAGMTGAQNNGKKYDEVQQFTDLKII